MQTPVAVADGGGAQFLDDLLDVTIGGAGGPFSTAPSMTLGRTQLMGIPPLMTLD